MWQQTVIEVWSISNMPELMMFLSLLYRQTWYKLYKKWVYITLFYFKIFLLPNEYKNTLNKYRYCTKSYLGMSDISKIFILLLPTYLNQNIFRLQIPLHKVSKVLRIVFLLYYFQCLLVKFIYKISSFNI